MPRTPLAGVIAQWVVPGWAIKHPRALLDGVSGGTLGKTRPPVTRETNTGLTGNTATR